MNIYVPAPMGPPPPGTASPGDLYVDLQSRTMWLGVDTAIDPTGAVLLSDILSIDPAIDAAVAYANGYTDTQILTRSPTGHTHTASQITDFNTAVANVINSTPGFNWVRGMMMVFTGSMAEIGTGDLAGWALCDGSQGTPDMRDKFVLGAGNRAPGGGNSATKVTTDIKGSHIHTIGGTGLTWQQNGPHYHNVSVYGSGNTGTQSANHVHSSFGPWRPGGGSPFVNHDTSNDGDCGVHENTYTTTTSAENATHYHGVGFTSTGTTDTQGSGQTHTHTCANAGDHSHDITSNALREAIPYLLLAWIMKL